MAPAPAPRYALGVRGLLLLLVGLGGAYVLGMALYLGVTLLGPVHAALRRDARPTVQLFTQLADNIRQVNDLVHSTQELVGLPMPMRLRAAPPLRQDITRSAKPIPPELLRAVPQDLQQPLVLADHRIYQLKVILLEVVGLASDGRDDAAWQKLIEAHAINSTITASMGQAQEAQIKGLIERERVLSENSAKALRVTLLWIVGGVVGLAVALLLVSRRLAAPLAELEQGLTRVAEGDLSVRLPVAHQDEMGRLAEHFNQMTRVLAERAEEQGRFAAAGQLIAGVAHEVNNPLMAIAAMAQSRLEAENLAPEVEKDLKQITRQARRAGKLVSGLLRFVQIRERGSRPTDVMTVALEAVDLVSYQFAVNEIEFEWGLSRGLPRVVADPDRLEQVFVNLLSNAVDAVSTVPAPRRMGIRAYDAGNGRLGIEVWDSGPGVAPALKARLFLPFMTTKGRSGTGLGLYISRQIVREAGGDITAGTCEAGGASFYVTLPVAAAPEEPARSTLQPAAGTRGGRTSRSLQGVDVLVVDDEESVRRPIAEFLRRRGATVRIAPHGRDALMQLEEGPADVILADLKMPVMTGVEMLRALQERESPAAARILFLSGDLTLLDASTVPVDRNRILAKPADLPEIERRVMELLDDVGMVAAAPPPVGAGSSPHSPPT